MLQAVLFNLLSHADTTQCYWVILQDERKSTVVLASTIKSQIRDVLLIARNNQVSTGTETFAKEPKL